MKDLFLRFCRWALPLLGVTAAASCEIVAPAMYGPPPSGYEDYPVMYGTPTVEFSVKGKVVDSEGNPIPGIEVSQGADSYMGYKVYTAEDGTFDYSSEDIGFEMESISLTFTDLDGEENGGDFETLTKDIPVEQTDPGDGIWDNGDYAAEDIEIVMNKK